MKPGHFIAIAALILFAWMFRYQGLAGNFVLDRWTRKVCIVETSTDDGHIEWTECQFAGTP